MKLITARFGVLLALVLGVAMSAHAQEATMGEGMSAGRTVEMQGFGKTLKDLEDRVATSTTRLFKIKECHEAGKIFALLPDGTEGCKDVIPEDAPQSGERTFATPGTYNFTVPPHNNLQVEVWGGGGGGGNGGGNQDNYFGNSNGLTPGLKGGNSSFNGTLVGGGGLGGMYGYSYMWCSGGTCYFPGVPGSPGASGGGASGGLVNINGNQGGAGYVYGGVASTPVTGATGVAAGAGGAGGPAVDPSMFVYISWGTQFNPTAGAGGGSGGYARALYKAHVFNVGSVIQIVVGAGGAGGATYIYNPESSTCDEWACYPVPASVTPYGNRGTDGQPGRVRLLWN